MATKADTIELDEEILERQDEADDIVQSYLGWSAGAGLIPVPWLDMAAVTGLQIKMVASLTKLYDIPFSRNAVKSIVAALLGSVVPGGISHFAASAVKSVPVVGTTLGMFTMPLFATASTYAVGRVFIQHFEAGGNLLNFDVAAMREHFKREFESKGKSSDSKSS